MREFDQRPRLRVALAAGVSLAALSSTSCMAEKSPDPETADCSFTVFSQNRFKASKDGGYGAVVRTEPNINSEVVASFKGNDTIQAIGYVVTQAAAYPTNPEAINGDHWIVIKTAGDSQGYVSDAGVRSAKTKHDPTGLSDNLGPLVDFDALPVNCELTS